MEDWFNLDRYYDMEHNYNNDAFVAKMWIAKEMAKDVYDNSVRNPMEYLGWHPKAFSYLVQLLKKEWFR